MKLMVIGNSPASQAMAFSLCLNGMECTLVSTNPPSKWTLQHNDQYLDLMSNALNHNNHLLKICSAWSPLINQKTKFSARLAHHELPLPLNAGKWAHALGISQALLFALSQRRQKKSTVRQGIYTLENWCRQFQGPRFHRLIAEKFIQKIWGRPSKQLNAELSALALGWSHEFEPPLLQTKEPLNKILNAIEREYLHRGGKHLRGYSVNHLSYENQQWNVTVKDNHKRIQTLNADAIVVLDPISALAQPLGTDHGLSYRNRICVGLLVHWPGAQQQDIQIFSPEISATRIYHQGRQGDFVLVGLDYYCDPDSKMWNESDNFLLAKAQDDWRQLKLSSNPNSTEVGIMRLEKALPVYDLGYQQSDRELRDKIDMLKGPLKFLDERGDQFNPFTRWIEPSSIIQAFADASSKSPRQRVRVKSKDLPTDATQQPYQRQKETPTL